MKRRAASFQINSTSLGFTLFGSAVVALLAAISVLPFLLVVSGSFTLNSEIVKNGYSLIPSKFSMEAYQVLFDAPESIINSYLVTIFITAAGTATGLFLTSMTAYVLHRKDFLYRNVFSFVFFFTTLFSGGLIPWYLLMLGLGMRNSLLALIVPGLMNVFNIIIMRTFFSTLPESIGESGKIDGANDFRIYAKLYLPMAIPGLATIGLFMALAYWNEWFNALLFISKNSKLVPLQYQLYKIISDASYAAQVAQVTGRQMQNAPTESLKLAMVCVTVGPIILLFPYVQRYFIKGLTIGAVKG